MMRVFLLAALLASHLSAQATPEQVHLEQLTEDAHHAQLEKDYERAAKDYRQMLVEGPHSAELWANVGIMYHLAGKYSDAVPALRNSLKEDPTLFQANFFLGADLLALHQPQAAQPYLEKASQLKPNEPVVLTTLARDHMALGDARAANDFYLRATHLDALNVNAWFGLGATCFSLMRESLARFQAYPDSPSKRALLADKEMDSPLPVAEAEQVLAKSPDDERALLWHARAAKRMALEALQHAGELAPDSPRTHRILGEIFLEQADYDRARPEFESLLAQDPDSVPARLSLARIDEAQGLLREAFDCVEEVLKRQPGDPAASFIAADVLIRQGQFVRALPFAKDAVRAGDKTPPEAHALLAKVYEHEDQPEAAIAELIKALPADSDGSYHYRLSRLYRKTGRTQEASAALSQYRALQAKPVKQLSASRDLVQSLLQ